VVERFAAGVVLSVEGCVSAVALGARQDGAGKAIRCASTCHDGERQTQHTQWPEGRPAVATSRERRSCRGASSEVCGTAQVEGRTPADRCR
jgi:hypothetical protein